MQKFKFYCEHKKNEIFTTSTFWNTDRTASDSLEKWFNNLKTLGADCNSYDQKDRHVRDNIGLSLEDHLHQEQLIKQLHSLLWTNVLKSVTLFKQAKRDCKQ